MYRRTLTLVALLTVLLLALAACGGQQAAPSTEATEVPAEEAEVVAEESSDTEAAEVAEEAVAEETVAEETVEEEADATSADMRQFTVVPDQSTASYLVDEEFLGGALDKLGIAAGLVDVVGRTQEVAGQFEINVADGVIGANEFTVQIDTLTTDQDRRDNWVRTKAPGFAQFPVATFVATSLEDAPDGYSDGEEVTFQLVGDLTVRDIAVPTTFAVTATLDGDSIGGTAIADLLLSDFGINPPNFANTLTVEDAFQVKMELVAVAE